MIPAVPPWRAQTADRQRVMLKHKLDLALSERDTWRAEAHALRELLMMRKQRNGKHRMPPLHQTAVEAAEAMAMDDVQDEEEEHLDGPGVDARGVAIVRPAAWWPTHSFAT